MGRSFVDVRPRQFDPQAPKFRTEPKPEIPEAEWSEVPELKALPSPTNPEVLGALSEMG